MDCRNLSLHRRALMMSSTFSASRAGVENLGTSNVTSKFGAKSSNSSPYCSRCRVECQWGFKDQTIPSERTLSFRAVAGGNGWETLKAFTKSRAIVCLAADADRVAAVDEFVGWLKQQGFPDQVVTIKMIGKEGLGCAAAHPLKAGEVALSVPENFCVTAFDVNKHPVVSGPARGREDLIGLTLWLMYERAQGQASAWYPFLKLFPEATASPLLWTEAQRDKLLKGSPVLEDVKERVAALEEVYEELSSGFFEKDPQRFPNEGFSLIVFKRAFSVILSRATYLPTAEIFALVPYGDCFSYQGECEAFLDFSREDAAVVLKVDRDYKQGDQVFISYGVDGPNSDLLISYGFVDPRNRNDYLRIEVELLEAERLKGLKQQILEQAGFVSPQTFPLVADRFPTENSVPSENKASLARILYLVDIHPLCYEGRRPRPTAILKWMKLLFNQVTREDPVIAVMDGEKGNDYRRQLLPGYKATRNKYKPLSGVRGPYYRGDEMDLREAFPLIQDFLRRCNVPVLKVEDAEADDVVATLMHQAVSKGMRVVVASPDMDFRQLLSENVNMLLPLPEFGRWSFYTLEQYVEQNTCDPALDLGLRCIMGDSSDNVPGLPELAPGFGRKTALKLMKKHGSLESLLVAAKTRTVGKPYIQEALTQHADILYRNLQVLKLRRDLDITLNEEWCRRRDRSSELQAFQMLERKLL